MCCSVSRCALVSIVTLLLSCPRMCLAQPDNDLFVNRTLLLGNNVTTEVSLLDASTEPGEPPADFYTAGSVWYAWQSSADGALRLKLDALEYRTAPLIFVSTGDTLSKLEEQSPRIGVGAWEGRVKANTDYLISIGISPGYGVSAELFSRLHLQFIPRAANDDFAQRIPLSGDDSGEISAWTAGATLAPGEPAVDPNKMFSTVWWSWTAPANGLATFEYINGHAWDAATVFVGEDLADLRPSQRCDTQACLYPSRSLQAQLTNSR